jgi:hypothetical protein
VIVRILHEGQFEVDPATVLRLEELDAVLESTLHDTDEARFREALANLLNEVRTKGHLIPADTIVPSDLTVPYDGATLQEVAGLLTSETTEEN